MIIKSLRIAVASIVALLLGGCLITKDEAIPQTLRRPYFGQDFVYAMGDDKKLETVKWVDKEKAYIDEAGRLIEIAPAHYFLDRLDTRGEPVVTEFVVAIRDIGKPLLRSMHLLYAQRVHETGPRKSVFRGFFYTINVDQFTSHVVRHECLERPNPRQCVLNILSPGSGESLGVTVSQDDAGTQRLTRDNLWKFATRKLHWTPYFLVAETKSWQKAYNMLLNAAQFRRFDSLSPVGAPIGVTASRVELHSDVEAPK